MKVLIHSSRGNTAYILLIEEKGFYKETIVQDPSDPVKCLAGQFKLPPDFISISGRDVLVARMQYPFVVPKPYKWIPASELLNPHIIKHKYPMALKTSKVINTISNIHSSALYTKSLFTKKSD